MSVTDLPPLTDGQLGILVDSVIQARGLATPAQVAQKVTEAITAPAGMGTVAGKILRWWGGQATTDSGGNFSASYATANFTTVLLVVAVPLAPAATLPYAYQSTVVTRTATACSGFVTAPNQATIKVATIDVLNVANAKVGAGVPVDLLVFGI